MSAQPSSSPSGWSVCEISGTRCDVFQPGRINKQGYVLLYLHDEDGSPQLQDDVFSTAVDQHGLPVVVPRCGPTWWLDQPVPLFHAELSPQQFLIESVVPWMEQKYQTQPKQIGLAGDGMGGQGALQLAYRHPRRFPVVAAITPRIDFHYLIRDQHPLLSELFGEEEPARQRTAILFVQALNWPQFQFFCCDPANYLWWDGADRLRMKLAASGIPFNCELELQAAGDEQAYFGLMVPRALDYVVTQLERERLRIV